MRETSRVSSPIGRMITPQRAATWVPWHERITYKPTA